MMKLIEDLELIEALNTMYEENWIQTAKRKKYTAVKDNMMTKK